MVCGGKEQEVAIPTALKDEKTLVVTCRPKFFDFYIEKNGFAVFIGSATCEDFNASHKYDNFKTGFVSLCLCGNMTVSEVEACIDNGIGFADVRPVRYENGEVMVEQGKVYISASVRGQAGEYQ